jgi:predicted nucleic acid-binding protein
VAPKVDPAGRIASFIARAAAAKAEESVAPGRGAKQELPRTFFDSNVLLYAEDSRESRKRQIAIALILEHKRQRSGVVSIQVLQEFFVNATRKLRVDPAIARYKVEFHARFYVVEPSVADVLAAIDLHRLQNLSFWDALVLHSAKQSGCRVLLTEDMQHGQVIDGVRIVNPFL